MSVSAVVTPHFTASAAFLGIPEPYVSVPSVRSRTNLPVPANLRAFSGLAGGLA